MGVIIVELNRDVEQKYCVEKYLENRRGEKTTPYTRAIIDCLSKRFDDDSQADVNKDDVGWVVCSQILEEVRLKCPDIADSTFYRILGELVENHLIVQKKSKPGKRVKPYRPGKPPVYYRVPILHARVYFETREELTNQLLETIRLVGIDQKMIRASVNLFVKLHPDIPEPIIRRAIFLESQNGDGLSIIDGWQDPSKHI